MKLSLIIAQVFLITVFSVNNSFALSFNAGDYKIEFWSIPSGQGLGGKSILDVQCRTVKRIGWNIFNKSECELLSESTKDNNMLSYELKCNNDNTGVDNVSISVALLEDAFDGTAVFRKDNLNVHFIGKRVSSCAESRSLTKDGKINPLESQQEFEQYLKNKYQQIHDATTTVKLTSEGAFGSISLSGDIVPQKKAAIDLTKEPDRHVRARAIAKAFMEDEAALLGITKPDEIREFNISTDKGFGGDYSHINYRRYINDINLGDVLQITIGPNENISSVHAQLVAVPPEAYEATKKKTLSEEEIKSIIEADLTEVDKRDYDMNTIYKSFKKVARVTPPYVLWNAFYIYEYEIDAFTGKILSKVSTKDIDRKISPIIKDPTIPKGKPIPPPILPYR